MKRAMVTPIALGRDPSQTDRAVLGIRDLVLRGDFAAGDRLTELALVEILGVSRTPIRAALQRLAQEGLLAASPSTGYVVRGFSEAEVFDAIELRGAIEGLAARMAAERGASPAMLRDMRECLARIDELLSAAELGDAHLARYSALNSRFHELMLAASGSTTVAQAMQRVAATPFAAPNAFVQVQSRLPGSLRILGIAQAQHHEIVDAIEGRSSARVEPLVREHARNARRNLELVLGQGEVLGHLVGAPLIRRHGRA